MQMLAEQRELASQMQQLQQGFTAYMDASADRMEALQAQLAEQSSSNGSFATRSSIATEFSTKSEQVASTKASFSAAALEADRSPDQVSADERAIQQRPSSYEKAAEASEASDTQAPGPQTVRKGLSRKDAAEAAKTDAETLENESRTDDASKAAADAIRPLGTGNDSGAAGETTSASGTADLGMTGQADGGLDALGGSQAISNDQQTEEAAEASGSEIKPDSLEDGPAEKAGQAEEAMAEGSTAKAQSTETLAAGPKES